VSDGFTPLVERRGDSTKGDPALTAGRPSVDGGKVCRWQ
jgi:hypothetical protein